MKTLVRVGLSLVVLEAESQADPPEGAKPRETLDEFRTRLLVFHLRHRNWLLEFPHDYPPFPVTKNAYPR